MKAFDYQTKGVCSRGIHIEVNDDNVVTTVRFTGGCSGNTQGVARLAEGRSVDDVIGILKGIRCGMKTTSCPDQLACALEEFKQSL
ncbi:MAG: TIGR03905 family TSCPD domain-containing protein [Clostridia bacterium]|nr:TIGR03905 family TSCPD domain-containing protein [Clostridia bacterium]MBQ5819764.1 TIGR03905 family TSCPD domain-containing protein [Clostridia bacterium]